MCSDDKCLCIIFVGVGGWSNWGTMLARPLQLPTDWGPGNGAPVYLSWPITKPWQCAVLYYYWSWMTLTIHYAALSFSPNVAIAPEWHQTHEHGSSRIDNDTLFVEICGPALGTGFPEGGLSSFCSWLMGWWDSDDWQHLDLDRSATRTLRSEHEIKFTAETCENAYISEA